MKIRGFHHYMGIAGALLIPGITVAALLNLQVFKTGTPISSSVVNQNFSAIAAKLDELEQANVALQKRLGPTSAFRVDQTSNQDFTSGQSTIVDFQSVAFDLNDEFESVGNTFSPKVAGYYYLHCKVQFASVTGGDAWTLALSLNGTQVLHDAEYDNASEYEYVTDLSATGILVLKPTDKVACAVMQNSGGQAAFFPGPGRSFFEGFRLAL